MNWNQLKDLKKQYKYAQKRACNAKTKKTSEKYRDIALNIRRQLSSELTEWDFTGLEFRQFNVMPPAGGPYCLVDATEFKLEKNLGSCIQISFESYGFRWAGYIHWIDDKCGFDNMERIV